VRAICSLFGPTVRFFGPCQVESTTFVGAMLGKADHRGPLESVHPLFTLAADDLR
jgi:hypothetical protein